MRRRREPRGQPHFVLPPNLYMGPPGRGDFSVSNYNPHGNRHHTRHLLNQRFLHALLLDFDAHGREAIEECRKQSPLGYVKVLGHLVPHEMKVEHSQIVKSMSDQELEATIEYIRSMLAAQAGDKVIEGTAEAVALPAPKRPNRLMMEADTAVGPREPRPRQRQAPSPSG